MAFPIEIRRRGLPQNVRFNNFYSIQHSPGERALNSLHFVTAVSAGFLRTAAEPKTPRAPGVSKPGAQVSYRAAARIRAMNSPAVTRRAQYSLATGHERGDPYVPHDYPLETLEPGLEEQAYYDPVNFSFPGGAHVAEVEIDPETGIVQLVNYTAVDDVGTV